jgi:hypothetical protein
MKRILVLTSIVLTLILTTSPTTTTQQRNLGWDNISEPLNLAKSNIKWSVFMSRKVDRYILPRRRETEQRLSGKHYFFC